MLLVVGMVVRVHAACDATGSPCTTTSRGGLSQPVVGKCNWGSSCLNPTITRLGDKAGLLDTTGTWTALQTFGAGETGAVPTTQTVTSGGTIAADACGGVKRITGGPTTTTTTTLPTPGCSWYVAPKSEDCTPSSTGTGTLDDPYTNLYYAMTQAGSVVCGANNTLCLQSGTYRVNRSTAGIATCVGGGQAGTICETNANCPSSTCSGSAAMDTLGRFADDTQAKRYKACDDDPVHNTGSFDSNRTVLPLFKACASNTVLHITNVPGADVILDGGDAEVDEGKHCVGGSEAGTKCTTDNNCVGGGTCQLGNSWWPCESSSTCGTITTLQLTDYTKTYYTNVGTGNNISGTAVPDAQIWVDGDLTHPGRRLGWWADFTNKISSTTLADHDSFTEADLAPGQDTSDPIVGRFFAVEEPAQTIPLTNGTKPQTTFVARLASSYAQGAYDLDAHHAHLTTEGGFGTSVNAVIAAHNNAPTTTTSYITVEANTAGGSFTVQHGYDCLYVGDNSHHLTFKGLNIRECGGRSYGAAIRVRNGHDITVNGGTVRDIMGHGVSFYGGGPGGASCVGGNSNPSCLSSATCGGGTCTCNANGCGIQQHDNVVTNVLIERVGAPYWDGGGVNGNTSPGISLKNCANCVARRNTLRHTNNRGIEVLTSADACCAQDTAVDVTGNGTCSGTASGTACSSDGSVVDGNDISDIGQVQNQNAANLSYPFPVTSDVVDGSCVIWIASNNLAHASTGLIVNNYCHGPNAVYRRGVHAGIAVEATLSGALVEISNNVIRNIPGYCLYLQEITQSATTPFFNNVFSQCGTELAIPASIGGTTQAVASSHGSNAFDASTPFSLDGTGCPSGTCTCPVVWSQSVCWEATARAPVFGFGLTSDIDPHLTLASSMIDVGTTRTSWTLPGALVDDFDGEIRTAPWEVGSDDTATTVVTSMSATFTAPASGNAGCFMSVCNAGLNTIVLDGQTAFKTLGGPNAGVTLGPEDCVPVASDGTTWRQLGPVAADS